VETWQAFASINFLPFYWVALQMYVLPRSMDEIGQRNGYRLHSNEIHLIPQGNVLGRSS
jgi:hypothetical protein